MSKISLQDCYSKDSGRAFATGTQALVRLLIEQSQRDHEAGLKTRGLVSGYPGSPLGGLDRELNLAKSFLDVNGILFQPAVNEELAATALWGSQHLHLYDQPDIDGVFGLWYGKGPGLDRSLDAMRHANMGGVSKYGGMIFVVGDDATGKSSTVAYQSEQTFIAASVPFFYPRSVHDIIPMGLQAFALSRYAGCCVGLKIVVDTADVSAIIDLDATPRPSEIPDNNLGPVHIGRHDTALLRESRLFNLRLPAVTDFQHHQEINHDINSDQTDSTTHSGKLGIIAVGKAVPEVMEALTTLGASNYNSIGIGLMSIGMPWPIAPQILTNFATRYEEILVIEEKRPIVEDQLARSIVNFDKRGVISGKKCPQGTPLIPQTGELTHKILCDVIHTRATVHDISLYDLAFHKQPENLPFIETRTPWYCAGCPHNLSTKLPEGEITGMGIGCHSISGFITPETITNFTQMGGEGAFWVGRAPFSGHSHSFQNMGDGTYAHSGYMGVRAAVAADVNITFKILYNGTVAMTGGQAICGGQTPWVMSAQLAAEGVRNIAVVTDQPDALPTSAIWAKNTKIYHRNELMLVQKTLKSINGVTAIIYVQSCATELRRSRKRGKLPDRPEMVFINEDVCEGCGDCAQKSNCVAVKPVWHPEGWKKQIDHSICNKDYSCINGFCPSFVTITNSTPPTKIDVTLPIDITVPDPDFPPGISEIFIAGIGGTGVSTLSSIMVMAAHIDDIAGQAVNQTGLSQKNGGVTSQVRLSRDQQLDQRMVRLPTQGATLLIGCDGVVAANDLTLSSLHKATTTAIVNTKLEPVGVAGVGVGCVVGEDLVLNRLTTVMDAQKIYQFDFSDLAKRLFGSTTSSNIILLGWAVQNGHVPLSTAAIEGALKLNGVDVEQNIAALQWGRLVAVDAAKVMSLIQPAEKTDSAMSAPSLISYFSTKLTSYQNDAYAANFLTVIKPFIDWLEKSKLDVDHFGCKAAQALYQVMAIKDEYEVARLLTSSDFQQKITQNAGSNAQINFHLAPPFLHWIKDKEGLPRKFRFGGWLTPLLLILGRMRHLRGQWYDPFGYSHTKQQEKLYKENLVSWLKQLTSMLRPCTADQLDEILDLMLSIRGYGHVKDQRYNDAHPQIIAQLSAMNRTTQPIHTAAE